MLHAFTCLFSFALMIHGSIRVSVLTVGELTSSFAMYGAAFVHRHNNVLWFYRIVFYLMDIIILKTLTLSSLISLLLYFGRKSFFNTSDYILFKSGSIASEPNVLILFLTIIYVRTNSSIYCNSNYSCGSFWCVLLIWTRLTPLVLRPLTENVPWNYSS